MKYLQFIEIHLPGLAPATHPAVWKGLLRDDAGQDLIEYALVATLLSLTALSTLRGLGTKINSAFLWIGTAITNAT